VIQRKTANGAVPIVMMTMKLRERMPSGFKGDQSAQHDLGKAMVIRVENELNKNIANLRLKNSI